jgi:hypothetical protein
VHEVAHLDPAGPLTDTVPVGDPTALRPVTVTSMWTIEPGTGAVADASLEARTETPALEIFGLSTADVERR